MTEQKGTSEEHKKRGDIKVIPREHGERNLVQRNPCLDVGIGSIVVRLRCCIAEDAWECCRFVLLLFLCLKNMD
jgi:hypothetical protein